MHILIAEDHPDLRKILTLYLQKEGYQVSVVSDGTLWSKEGSQK